MIPRSKHPQVLTDEYPREVWSEAPDFRRAIAKGWLSLVSKDEYEKDLENQRRRAVELARMSAAEAVAKPVITREQSIFSDDPSDEPQVIDEDSAQLKPASQDKRARQFMEYEGQEFVERPAGAPTGSIDQAHITSRSVSFCEEQKNGTLTANQALEWLEGEEGVLTKGDLEYITSNAAFDSVKSLARTFLADR